MPAKPKNQVKKTGRPGLGEEREKLTLVNFRADGATLAAISALEDAFPAGALGRRAAAIRTALIEAANRLRVQK